MMHGAANLANRRACREDWARGAARRARRPQASHRRRTGGADPGDQRRRQLCRQRGGARPHADYSGTALAGACRATRAMERAGRRGGRCESRIDDRRAGANAAVVHRALVCSPIRTDRGRTARRSRPPIAGIARLCGGTRRLELRQLCQRRDPSSSPARAPGVNLPPRSRRWRRGSTPWASGSTVWSSRLRQSAADRATRRPHGMRCVPPVTARNTSRRNMPRHATMASIARIKKPPRPSINRRPSARRRTRRRRPGRSATRPVPAASSEK